MDRHLNISIEELKSSYSSSCVREAIETLLTIHRNIYFNRNDPKYKTLKLQNEAFCRKVWNVKPAQRFMLHCGWKQVGKLLHFENDAGLLTIINFLLEHRNVHPKDNEWKTESKVENLYTSKQLEEKLRAKAAMERQKELEEFQKEKLYRQQIAENVKKQIADDRARNRQLHYRELPVKQPRRSTQTVVKRLCD